MKVRINAAVLSQLPPVLREIVEKFRKEKRKSHFNIEYRRKVFCQEDATYTAFSPDLSKKVVQRAAGEWAGMTRLSPTAEINLPPGGTIVETGYFLGVPFLNIFHNNEEDCRLLVADNNPLLLSHCR